MIFQDQYEHSSNGTFSASHMTRDSGYHSLGADRTSRMHSGFPSMVDSSNDSLEPLFPFAEDTFTRNTHIEPSLNSFSSTEYGIAASERNLFYDSDWTPGLEGAITDVQNVRAYSYTCTTN